MDWPKMILLSDVHCITFCTLFLRTDLSHSSKLRAVTFARQIEWGDLKDRKEKTLCSKLGGLNCRNNGDQDVSAC